MEQLTVSISAEVAAELQRRVDAGGFASASDIVHEALEDWVVRHDEEDDLDALREAIRIGDESGPSIPAEEVFAELRAIAAGRLKG